jgi:lipopolysaccharide export system protein LptA
MNHRRNASSYGLWIFRKGLTIRGLCASLLLGVFNAGMALETDRSQPIRIQADNVKLNEKTGISEYRGNVEMIQGSIKLNGDRVVIHHVKGKLAKIVITGSPARFQQRPEKGQELVKARAQHMEYLTKNERLILNGQAEVTQGPNLFSGEHIDFDTRQSTVTARGGGREGDRVRAVIHPNTTPERPE